jgi:hypothetical protein
MPFVNRSGGEDEDVESTVAAGAPPLDWDPDDPDTVKVHYDVSAWSFDQRAELAEALADASLPHTWHGDELVIPEVVERDADALFEQLDQELGPFPVVLGPDEPATEFGLDEWPAGDLDLLRGALVEAEIPHRWDGTTVFVATDAEHEVDDLLDAIERGDVAMVGDADGPPEGSLNRLFTIGDRLARDPTDGPARDELLELAPILEPRRPPFGVAVRSWGSIVAAASALAADFVADDFDDSDVIGHAQELRTTSRPFV